MTPQNLHAKFMGLALETARNCVDIKWYGVGCVIVAFSGEIISTGYTGEFLDIDGSKRHAEEIAISKAYDSGQKESLKSSVLYSTLEPCSCRSSKKKTCVENIVEAEIPVVVFGAHEPFDIELGVDCEGEEILQKKGIKVLCLKEFEQQCLESAMKKGNC